MEPTVFVNTNPQMTVVREEIFGPVLVVQPFEDLDDVAAMMNDSDYGLAAGIWTRDISKAHLLARKVRAGTVWINCYHAVDAALPFGGYRQSGWGREMGHEVLNAYTEVKSVCALL
jgi:phenylacetaldehyde dehydrogenase